MAYFTTALDLKVDGLDLAGEPATNSEYDDVCYEWLTIVQRSLISGGQWGPTPLQPLDWGWARAYPRGTIQLVQPYNRNMAADALFTTGSTQVIVSAATPDLRFHRIVRSDVAARHLILSQFTVATTTFLQLQDPWTGPGDTVNDWWAYPDTYTLPEDFVRGVSPLYLAGVDLIAGPGQLDVIESTQMENQFPHAAVMGGMPQCAARVTQDRLRFSHYLDTPDMPQNVQVEFEYIARPPVLAEGSIPAVPIEHRRILSYGLAYLILADKDDAGAESLWSMFQAQYKAMRDDEIRDRMKMSSRWGVIQPARASALPLRRTESGLPIFVW